MRELIKSPNFLIFAILCFLFVFESSAGLMFLSPIKKPATPAPTGFVTAGLVFEKDASKYNGTTFPGTGCAVTTWTDLINSGFNGTLTGFIGCLTDGWTGNGTSVPYALTLNGTTDYVQGVNNTIDITSTDITVQLWFNLAVSVIGISDPRLIDLHDPSGHSLQFGIDDVAGNLTSKDTVWQSGATGILYTTTPPSLSTWYNAALVVNTAGNTTIGYVNDTVQSQSASSNIGQTADTSSYFLGARKDLNSVTFFNGQIAIALIYNRQLSAAEVKQNCDAVSSRFSGLVCN